MIDSIEVPSRSRAEVKHTLWIYEGVAKGCTCEARQYNQSVPCWHMVHHNEQVSDVTPHIEDDLRNSCCLCGRPTKGIVCWKCLQ